MIHDFIAYTVAGLFLGSAYSIAASGLVLTYSTTRVFNLAHGAISMLMAYIYWQLQVAANLPTWLAVALVLLVIAPAFGLILERCVTRGLGDAPVGVSLVVTVGVFVFLVGAAQQFWPATTYRNINYIFDYHSVTLFGVRILDHYLLTIAAAIGVAGALYVLLNRTRIGTAMRASVDNTDLLSGFGARAERISQLSWAVGSSLAALAGILLVAYTGLDYYTLTFLVISSFAAALLGRLRNLPLTFVGAIALGLATSYVQGYVHVSSAYLQTGLQSSLPTFMLFAVLVATPQVRLRVGQVKGVLAAEVPAFGRSVVSGAALLVVTLWLVESLDPTNLLRFGIAASYAIVMLSLVLLTGYGGYVSLAQLTFVGVGAGVAAKLDTTSPIAILIAAVAAAAVGAIVALPVLRLTGLYLALATLAFGQLMDKLVFQGNFFFGFGRSLPVKRISLFGYQITDTPTYVLLVTAVFVLIGIGILALRRGAVGRILIALRDSPAACATLGLNHRWFRVGVFSLSAGVAGLAGALFAGLQGFATATPFATLQSLPLLLVAVVAGVTSVTGALFGGILLMLVQVIPTVNSSSAGVVFLVVGAGAILVGRDPNGLVNYLFRTFRLIGFRIQELRGTSETPPRPKHQVTANDTEDTRLSERQVAGHGTP